jgi:hypothetical protein
MLFVWLLRTVLDEGKRYNQLKFSILLLLFSSEFSETIQFSTLGTIPTEPDPPMLYEKGVKYLTLTWMNRPTDESFTLQMNDESNYFRNKYTGPLLTYTVTDLYRNTEYKFRVIDILFLCFK